MFRLMRFEFQKIIYNKKNIVLLVIMAIYAISIYVAHSNYSNHSIENNLNTINSEIEMLEPEIASATDQLKDDSLSGEGEKSLEQYIATASEHLKSLDTKRQALLKEDIDSYWKEEKKDVDALIEGTQSLDSDPENANYLYLTSTLLEAMEKTNSPYEVTLDIPQRAFSYLPSSIAFLTSMLAVLFMAMVVGDIYAKEYNGNSIMILNSVVPNKRSILFSKVLVHFFVTIMSCLSILLLIFVVSGLLNGWGSITYPVVIGNYFTGYHVISVLSFVAITMFYYALVLLFIISIAFLIGVLTKSSVLSLGITGIVVITAFVLTENPQFSKFMTLTPFGYFDSASFVSGNSMTITYLEKWQVSLLFLLTIVIINMINLSLLHKKK